MFLIIIIIILYYYYFYLFSSFPSFFLFQKYVLKVRAMGLTVQNCVSPGIVQKRMQPANQGLGLVMGNVKLGGLELTVWKVSSTS